MSQGLSDLFYLLASTVITPRAAELERWPDHGLLRSVWGPFSDWSLTKLLLKTQRNGPMANAESSSLFHFLLLVARPLSIAALTVQGSYGPNYTFHHSVSVGKPMQYSERI